MVSLTDHSDEELARCVQQGDQGAFGLLVDRYEAKLLRYGNKFLSRREDMEDIVQEIFMSVYQNIQSFDTSARFSPWMYRIAHNAFINGIRKNERSPVTLFDFDTLLSHTIHENPVEIERDQKEVRLMLTQGLDALAPKYREVLILYYLEDMPYKEIADILQVPTGTVGIRLKRAKEQLKEVYSKMNIDYGA